MATLSLLTRDGDPVDGSILLAALGALAAGPKRSLALCLLGGFAGYALGRLLL